MFSSGDELVLAACHDFVKSNDADVMENMIKREWSIYCKNNKCTFKSDTATVPEKENEEEEEKPRAEAFKVKEIPEVLSTATNCLAELGDLTANESSAILASYSKGNNVVADVYETYMQDGDTDTFLSMLRVIAPTLAKHNKEEEEEEEEEKEQSKRLLREAFQQFGQDDTFRPVDLAALRLAATRNDKRLISSLLDYKDDGDIEALKLNLLSVVAYVVAEFEE